jgi:hypothetical protein
MTKLSGLPMKSTLPSLLLVFAAALSACSHPAKTKPKDVTYDPTLQAGLDIPSYSRNALDDWPEGRRVDPYDTSRVRLPEDVHAYELGRLPSRDRREMHEAHTVYRVEQSNRWDQRLPATPMSSHGVVLGIREPSHSPIPPDQLVANERTRQAQITADLQSKLAQLSDKQQQLSAFLASAPDKNKTIVELQQKNAAAEKELAALKEDYRRTKDDLRELKERQAMEDALSKGTKKSDKPDGAKPDSKEDSPPKKP